MTRLFVASALAALLVVFSPSPQAQSLAVSPATADAAVAHLRAHSGLGAPDVADLVPVSGHVRPRTGEARVYVQQRLDGIDIGEAIVGVRIGRDGRVRSTSGDLVARLDAPTTQKAAALGAEGAVQRAAGLVGLSASTLRPLGSEAGPMRRTRFEAPGIAREPVEARLVYVPVPERGLRLAWEVTLYTADAQHLWVVRVDALTGAELQRFDLVVHDTFGPAPALSLAPVLRRDAAAMLPTPELLAAPDAAGGPEYTVFAFPVESPSHTTPAGTRTTVSAPADATASPFGWHDTDGVPGAEFTITHGNNVHAYSDAADDDTGDPGDSPDCTAALVCDFSLDLAMPPPTYTAAATTNLFYWNNIVHDVMHGYGFTSEAGNFQASTYGAGGVGGDEVFAESQDGESLDNANFATPADGLNPRMQMFLWDTDGDDVGDLDGDFDNGVIVHEYGHGISNRLVGGPTVVTCLGNAEQMGEGWSDWYALMFTMKPGDTGPDPRGIGTFVLDEPPTGPGIRPAPYSTDFGVNSFTYGATATGTLSIPHGIGFVWATALWEATWAMIEATGYDPDLYDETGTAGNQVMMHIVTEALTLTECSPGFLAGRDAVLEAAATLYPDPVIPDYSPYHEILWAAFAARGMGVSMDQKSPFTNVDNLEAFDTPPPAGSAMIAPASIAATLAPGTMGSVPMTIAHTGAPGTGDLHITATVVDGTVPLAPDAPPSADKAPGVAASLTGGPDAYGYTFADSDEPGVPTAPFTDITGTGVEILPGDWTPTGSFPPTVEGYVDVPLPFPFPFYGRVESTARIFVNGFISFSDYKLDSFVNTGLPDPTAGAPDAMIAAFWDDILLGAASSVHFGDLPDGRFAVQYTAIEQPGIPVESLTFQIILSDSGDIEIQYGTMSGTLDSATVGIENHDGTDGLEVVFDSPYVASDKAVLFTAPPLWAAVAPGTGTVLATETLPLTVFLDASALPVGTYSTDIVVGTDDPAALSTTVPLTLTVAESTTGVVDGVAGWRLLAPPHAGLTVDDLAGMNLVAGIPDYYPTFSEDDPGAEPTLYTGYDGADWVAATGTGEALELGEGFFWYLYDADFTPTEATTLTSSSVALPFTLAPTAPFNTADVAVPLSTDGNRYNVLGNPFGTGLDLSAVTGWPGGARVASKGRTRVWDSAASSWIDGATASPIAAWQGFVLKAKRSGGTLTIPASASTPGGVLLAKPETPPRTLSLALSGTDAATGRPLADRDLDLLFEAGASAAWDDADAEKLAPLSDAYVLLGVLGEHEGAPALKAAESRPESPGSFSVPLALDAVGAAPTLTLRWPTLGALPAAWQVTLHDALTGETVDLRTTDRYTFTAESDAVQARSGLGAPAIREADASRAEVRFTLRVETAVGEVPEAAAFALAPVRPNPVRGEARVAFSLAEAGEATVTVLDVRGREVARVVDRRMEAGPHVATWATAGVAPGLYLVRLSAGAEVQTRRAVVVR